MRYAALLVVSGLFLGCPSPDYIDIEPGSATLKQKNNTVWLKARVRAHNGTEFPKALVGWTSKDPEVVAVDGKGRLTPVKSGTTEVVASYRGLTASIPVEVLFAERMEVKPNPVILEEHGDPLDIEVTAYDYRGRPLRDRTAFFKSLDPKVLTMGKNAAHPGEAGETKVEVRLEEMMEVVDVTVKGTRPARK